MANNYKVRLAYQSETGLSLDSIDRLAEHQSNSEYVAWLEELAGVMIGLQEINSALNTLIDGKNKET